MELIKTLIDVNSTETHQIYANSDEEFGIGIQGYLNNTIINLKANEVTLSTRDIHSFTPSKWNQSGYAVFSFPSFKEKIWGMYSDNEQTGFSFNLTINKAAYAQPTKVYSVKPEARMVQSMGSYSENVGNMPTRIQDLANKIWYVVGTNEDDVNSKHIDEFIHVEPYTTMPAASAMMSGSLCIMTSDGSQMLIPAKAGSKYGWVNFNPGIAGQTITESMFATITGELWNVSIFVCREEVVYGRMAFADYVHVDAINKTIDNAIKLSLISDASKSEINSNKMVFGRGVGQIVIDADTTTAGNSKIRIGGKTVASTDLIPTKMSELANDGNFLKKATTGTGVALQGATPPGSEVIAALNADANTVYSTGTTLGQLALASQVPTKTSQLTNDSNFLTAIPDLDSYRLATATLAQADGKLTCEVDNYAITKVDITDGSTPVDIYLPRTPSDTRVRDFVLYIQVNSDTAPTVGFIPYGTEEINFQSDDDSWADVEPGVNIISFTEMKRS